MSCNETLLVFDLEATCDEHESESIRGENREMIEIGAVKVDLVTGEALDSFQSFVRPTRNPELTDFCRNLLGISQRDVDQAQAFDAVRPQFIDWAGPVCAAASWGNFDVHQWAHDSRRFGLGPELPWEHINLKKAFAKAMGMRRRGLGGVYAELGLEAPHGRHRALVDAQMVAQLLEECPEFLAYARKSVAADGSTT